jgi:hypothetical protein
MRRLCFAVSVAGLVTIASALAQAPDTLGAQQRTGFALERLRVGQWVRIRTSGAGFVQGWISNSPNVVTLRTADGSTIAVPASSVDALWVKHGTHAGTGALIGGAVSGIGLGALAVAATADANARGAEPCPCDEGGVFAVSLFVGGAGGAVVGALIGAASPKWQLRVP